MKKIIVLPILFLVFQGCIVLSGQDKVVYTTYRTLQTATEFRHLGLTMAGELYKKGDISEHVKDDIIKVGNQLQGQINSTVDALANYKQTGDYETLKMQVSIYQQVYGKFVDLVLPYMLEEI